MSLCHCVGLLVSVSMFEFVLVRGLVLALVV